MPALKRFWEAWKRFGQAIGDFIGRLILSLLYFTVVLPFGVGVRLFSDPLRLKRGEGASHWLARTTKDLTVEDGRKQY